MARTLDPQAHALRRDAYVEVGQRLIATRGYDEFSVQDVLDELGSSKGAFYHYFESKAALLDAVIESTVDGATAAFAPLASDPDLPADQKLAGLFSTIAQWKDERRELMLEIIRVWFCDENTIVRERFRRVTATRLTPVLAVILRQGVTEGTFTVNSPDGTAGVLMSLILGLNEVASRLFLARQAKAISFEEVERTLVAYTDAFERILGLPAGTLVMGNPELLQTWFG